MRTHNAQTKETIPDLNYWPIWLKRQKQIYILISYHLFGIGHGQNLGQKKKNILIHILWKRFFVVRFYSVRIITKTNKTCGNSEL